jgi:hypothetical protein
MALHSYKFVSLHVVKLTLHPQMSGTKNVKIYCGVQTRC